MNQNLKLVSYAGKSSYPQLPEYSIGFTLLLKLQAYS